MSIFDEYVYEDAKKAGLLFALLRLIGLNHGNVEVDGAQITIRVGTKGVSVFAVDDSYDLTRAYGFLNNQGGIEL